MKPLRIATRASRLAIWQAEHVAQRLRLAHPGLEVELLRVTTTGDQILDRPLADIGGKGLFIKELEVALQEQRADIAVHSMKDVPAELPAGFEIGAILEREDPRDALVSPGGGGVSALRPGARVGTSSLRRRSQLLASRPDLDVANLRGNVPTRLRRLDNGDFDAVVLAVAGLVRLELMDAKCHGLTVSQMLPAVGQGAVGIELRTDDEQVARLIEVLHDAESAVCVAAERAMNHSLGGSCQVPIAGHAILDGSSLTLCGLVASIDGTEVVRQTATGSVDEAAVLGLRVGRALLAAGADRILRSLGES